jgi:hypothetical protein
MGPADGTRCLSHYITYKRPLFLKVLINSPMPIYFERKTLTLLDGDRRHLGWRQVFDFIKLGR